MAAVVNIMTIDGAQNFINECMIADMIHVEYYGLMIFGSVTAVEWKHGYAHQSTVEWKRGYAHQSTRLWHVEFDCEGYEEFESTETGMFCLMICDKRWVKGQRVWSRRLDKTEKCKVCFEEPGADER